MYLDDICAAKHELLDHLARHHIAGNDGGGRMALTHPPHGVHEELGVAVRHVHADERHLKRESGQ